MKSIPWIPVALLALVAVGHSVSKANGFYNTYQFADITLHILAGIMFGSLYIWYARKYMQPWFLIFVSAASFAVFGSYLWEIWEFYAWQIWPERMVYVPRFADTLGDIACGMLGGAIAPLFSVKIRG